MKSKIFLSILILLYLSTDISSQKEDYNWIFNQSSIDSNSVDSEWMGSVLDFNSLPPTSYRKSNITLDFDKTNAIISDSLGNIFMYTNGQAIYGKDHEPIINGEVINYSPKWECLTSVNEFGEVKPRGMRINQLISLIPWPRNSEKWIALYHNYENTVETDYYDLWYSIIEENENGLEILEKDIELQQNIFNRGMVTACQHGNGIDWWIIQGQKDSLHFFLFDESGIKLDHTQILSDEIENTFGQGAFSKQGNSFATFGITNQPIDDEYFESIIFYSKLDRCSGLIDNIQTVKFESKLSILNNGIAFSPNGRFLYISEIERILQFDTSEENFLDNPIIVGEWDGYVCDHWSALDAKFGTMQHGPDEKIYISGNQQCFFIHTIDNPDEKGSACNFVQRAIHLESFHIGTVPNFNTLRLGPIDGSSCDTLGIDNHPVSKFWYEQDENDHREIQFRDVSYYRPETWSWTFGDGNSSDEMNPLHSYDSNGNYEVCLRVSNENSSNTSCQELQIGPVANQNTLHQYAINIFPNPVEDVTRIVFEDYLPEHAEISLFNLSGQKIFSARVFQECQIDLSSLNPGAYLYEITDGENLLNNGKMVKL